MLARTILSSLLGGGTVPVLVVIGLVGALGTAYVKGRLAEAKKAQVAELKRDKNDLVADRNRLRVQVKVAAQALEQAGQQSEEDARVMGALEKQVEDYKSQQPPVGAGKCDVLDADDVEFLRKIR